MNNPEKNTNDQVCLNVENNKNEPSIINETEQNNNFKEEIIILKKKKYDMKLRTQAKIENINKQSINSINQIKSNAKKIFITKLIPIIDELQEIIQYNKNKKLYNHSINQGLSLTFKCLLDILSKHGLKLEGKEKQIFDPKLHEIISQKSNTINNKNHIKFVNKIGYIFKNEILRKAIVTLEENTK